MHFFYIYHTLVFLVVRQKAGKGQPEDFGL